MNLRLLRDSASHIGSAPVRSAAEAVKEEPR
jgi:hypothetical protein